MFRWLRHLFLTSEERAALEWLRKSQHQAYWEAYAAMAPYETIPYDDSPEERFTIH